MDPFKNLSVEKSWYSQAIDKLGVEAKKVSGQKESIMSTAVLDAVTMFCKQEPEFAQAVVQGGSFADCMKSVAKGVGNSISDLEAYKKAVQFYFPGAKVQMQLTIDLIGDAANPVAPVEPAKDQEAPRKKLELNLEDFF